MARASASDRNPRAQAELRVFRDGSHCRLRCRQALRELKKVEALSADAQVEVDEDDGDLEDRGHQRVDNCGRGGEYPRGGYGRKDDLKQDLAEKDEPAKG